MLTTVKREKTVTEKTNYMEVLGANRVVYRVTSSRKIYDNKEYYP